MAWVSCKENLLQGPCTWKAACVCLSLTVWLWGFFMREIYPQLCVSIDVQGGTAAPGEQKSVVNHNAPILISPWRKTNYKFNLEKCQKLLTNDSESIKGRDCFFVFMCVSCSKMPTAWLWVGAKISLHSQANDWIRPYWSCYLMTRISCCLLCFHQRNEALGRIYRSKTCSTS